MVDLVTLQTISYIVGGVGVCVAAVYYVMMVRNMENARKKDIVFQRLQMPLQFYQAYGELLYARDITSFETLRTKWGGKPDEMAKLWYVLNHFNSLGILIEEGLATPKQIFKQYLPIGVIRLYERFKGEMINSRYRHEPKLEIHNPDAYKGFELLYDEAKRLYPDTPMGPYTDEELIQHAREIDDLLRSGATLP
jgi:hypothetical protein